jgi:hypothetical protein
MVRLLAGIGGLLRTTSDGTVLVESRYWKLAVFLGNAAYFSCVPLGLW